MSVFFCFSFSHPVLAGDKISIKVSPLYYDLQINLGAENSGKIYVENASQQELEINIEASDFFIDDAGNYIFSEDKSIENEELKPYLMRDWFSFNEKSLRLAVGQGRNIDYQIKVPENANLGGHYGVVFFRTKCTLLQDEKVVATDKSSLCISGRAGVLFLIQAGGEVKKSGQINKVEVPRISFQGKTLLSVEIANTGNTHFKPEGNIKITSLTGQGDKTLEIKDKTILPKLKYSFQADIEGGDMLGIYKITGAIKDGDGHNMQFQRYIFIPQWKKIGILVLAVIAIIYLSKKYRIQKKAK